MNTSVAIVADFDASNSTHAATDDALEHSARALGADVEHTWVGTEELAGPGATRRLAGFAGLWIGPASPYRSMDGALTAIRLAREQYIPLLGTCGGFQHMIIEYARNVLGMLDADHEESSPGGSRLVISRLSCSLKGRTKSIRFEPGSLIARAYGRASAPEQYRCNFGVQPEFADELRGGSLRFVGSDDEGVVRAVELQGHPFFIGTLFLPQLGSTMATPHPVITEFLRACISGTASAGHRKTAATLGK